MHKPGNRAFAIAFERNDVSVPAHRDYAVLKILGILRRSYEKLQLAPYVVVDFADADAYLTKLVRGVVRNFRFAQKRRKYSVFEWFVFIKP